MVVLFGPTRDPADGGLEGVFFALDLYIAISESIILEAVFFMILIELVGQDKQLIDVLGGDFELLGSDSLDDDLLKGVEREIGPALVELGGASAGGCPDTHAETPPLEGAEGPPLTLAL